jgi:aminopeptidase N
MRNVIWIISLLIFLMPVSAWSVTIDYALDVNVDTEAKKISGSASISADGDTDLSLSVGNLHHVTMNGKDIVRNLNDTATLSVRKNQTTLVTFEADLGHAESAFIDSEHVFLSGSWYPLPDTLVRYRLSVTLPETFVAVAEADTIRSKSSNGSVIYQFYFNHPLDRLHLAASSRYIVSRDHYNDIALETYFFKEEADLAPAYMAHAKKYLQMYEDMLTPYPYMRFAIVENLLPTGNSMPTFTLLGQEVIRLPFIVKTSLGHEILHQWFGNSVYIDLTQGNWAEGLTTYLSDHELAVLDNQGTEYRKQIMVDYAAYVRADDSLSLSNFFYRNNKDQSIVGYGKSAMFFHSLRKRFGNRYFFEALQNFIKEKGFSNASWSDIQASFEKITGKDLAVYFERWLHETDIPHLRIEEAEFVVINGKMKVKLRLQQQNPPYPLTIPISIYFEKGARIHFIKMNGREKTVLLPVHDLPTRVVVDESYDIMRHLAPEEIPPVLANIMGSDKLTVVVRNEEKDIYQPLVDALGVGHVTFLAPDQIALSAMKDRTLLIAGYNNDLLKMIAGKREIPDNGVQLNVIRNPYNASQNILLAHVGNTSEALAVQKKLRHYGKYSELIFNHGKVTRKYIDQAKNGLPVLSHQAPKAVKPSTLPTLDQIIPELSKSKIIYIGEKHDQFAHHINQLLIIKKLNERGVQLAVGMEIFKKPYQQVIDDYLAGRIYERQFLKRSQYFSEWGYNYHHYKPIIDYLKTHNIPLVALNLEANITSRVAQNGMDGLGKDEKIYLPESLDFTDKKYSDDLRKVYAFHSDQDKLNNFNYFLQAQVLWDESMAENAHAFLKTSPHRTLIVLAGNGHFKNKYGIPKRLYRRNQEDFVVVLQDEALEKDIADYVLIPEKLKVKEAPKLGVTVKEKNNRLKIKSVLDKSPAKNAKLKKGDVIQYFDTHPITSLADLRLALFYAEYGKTYEMAIKRDDDKIKLKIKLSEGHTSLRTP